jgi:hypothetical protein
MIKFFRRVAELQFLRFRRSHDPHVPAVSGACISACSHATLMSQTRHRWKLHCGHSSSSALNLFVWLYAILMTGVNLSLLNLKKNSCP